MAKVVSITDAVASIPEGAHVALSGFAIARCAVAFAHEVIRQGIKELTISQCVAAIEADLLIGGGAVKRFIYGGGSRGRFGQHHCVNRGIESGTLIAEEYSSLSMTFRNLAGSLGLPFIPIRSIQGSDIFKRLQETAPSEINAVEDPFTGENWFVLKPLTPDVAVVQVQVADEEGNAIIYGARWDNEEQVRASKRAIVITERLVSTEEIRRNPELTRIPGFKVSHVVHLPFSAHPSSVYRVYNHDEDHIMHYAEASKTTDGLHKYLDKYIYGVNDHWGYLELIGGLKRLNELTADPVKGY